MKIKLTCKKKDSSGLSGESDQTRKTDEGSPVEAFHEMPLQPRAI